ncbi:MAG: DNA polymerase III subunit gamma/tau [Eubacterium sp.]|nr:DNA polymerase III subunit gamma/tau [Eubacterium sp.]
MSYLALYRKFRPTSFDEVKGQDHIVTTLKNQLAGDRIGHAYLFCGTRGTGKTSVAKLLARTLNCDNPTENGPCGECPSCKANLNGTDMNVHEIDAATNNGVDNMRQLNENIRNIPMNNKHLIYIIDEAHMLTGAAFNAMLKTLEEPPEYAVFILATTDDYTIPITVKSRCQRFDFHRISVETITDRLEEVVAMEGEKATRDALSYIARAADGSLRDALSILDECMAASMGKELDRDSVLNTVGAVKVDIYFDLLGAITENDPERVLNIINDAVWDGKDLTKFADDFTWFVRNMLFMKLSPNIGSELDMTSENVNRMKSVGADISTSVLSRYLGILQELCSSIRKSSIQRVTFEMAMIKLMHPETDVDVESLIRRIDALENRSGGPAYDPETNQEISRIESREVEALVDARLEKKLPKLLKEMGPVASAPTSVEESNTAHKYGINLRDPAAVNQKQGEIIDNNLRKSFPPAEYEDLQKVSNIFRAKILPQLKNPLKLYLREDEVPLDVDKNYRIGSTLKLLMIFYDVDLEENHVHYTYYRKEENKAYLENTISNYIQKNVEIEYVVRKGKKPIIDEDSLAINKIAGKINTYENEEERNG